MDKPVEWLSKVAERHKEWVAIVKSFGEYNYAEDVVQELYIVLYKYANEEKIIKNGVVSRGYIYFSLRSIIFQLHNSKRKINKVSLDDEEFTYEIMPINFLTQSLIYTLLPSLLLLRKQPY